MTDKQFRWGRSLQACDPSIPICLTCAESHLMQTYGSLDEPPDVGQYIVSRWTDGRKTLAFVLQPGVEKESGRRLGLDVDAHQGAIAVTVPPSDGLLSGTDQHACNDCAAVGVKIRRAVEAPEAGKARVVII